MSPATIGVIKQGEVQGQSAHQPPRLTHTSGASVGFQLWVRETQSLFLSYSVFIVFFFHQNTCKPAVASPCVMESSVPGLRVVLVGVGGGGAVLF